MSKGKDRWIKVLFLHGLVSAQGPAAADREQVRKPEASLEMPNCTVDRKGQAWAGGEHTPFSSLIYFLSEKNPHFILVWSQSGFAFGPVKRVPSCHSHLHRDFRAGNSPKSCLFSWGRVGSAAEGSANLPESMMYMVRVLLCTDSILGRGEDSHSPPAVPGGHAQREPRPGGRSVAGGGERAPPAGITPRRRGGTDIEVRNQGCKWTPREPGMTSRHLCLGLNSIWKLDFRPSSKRSGSALLGPCYVATTSSADAPAAPRGHPPARPAPLTCGATCLCPQAW